MASEMKGKSPFYPGQPIPVDLFVGRVEQINHILIRGVGQVKEGKPVTIYVQGEYGIGKSSIAGFLQWVAEKEHGLFAVYAPLGGAENLDDVGAAILEATVRAGGLDPKRAEKVRGWLAKYIGEQSLFGITIHAEALRKDAPEIAAGILPFLGQLLERLKEDGIKGLFLVLDEVNGIAKNPRFAHFIKGLVDTNAMSEKPLPLLLMLCGVEERRRDLIRQHQPVDRIFDVVEIGRMTDDEMRVFFSKAFDSVHIKVSPEAMQSMVNHAGGFPKIMHLVGDAAYWIDQDSFIDESEAIDAVLVAAEDVGRKYVDQQVFRALRSKDYQSILDKLGALGPGSTNFHRADVVRDLTEGERRKFDNFLQKMKSLRVIRSGDVQGEYIFNVPMVRLYIWMVHFKKSHRSAKVAGTTE